MSDNISVTGNIATEPDYKRTPSGLAITNFRLVTSERRFDRATGAWVDGARNFYSIATFRSLAEHAFTSLKKGDRVVVSGRLRVRDWDAGAKHGTSVEIDADSVGHDLLWGTTTFHKSPRGTGPSLPATAADDQWQAALENAEPVGDHVPDSWNVPGGSASLHDAAATASPGDGDGTPLALTPAADSAPF